MKLQATLLDKLSVQQERSNRFGHEFFHDQVSFEYYLRNIVNLLKLVCVTRSEFIQSRHVMSNLNSTP